MLTKAEAMSKLDGILGPLNLRQSSLSVKVKFRDFVTGVFFPFYKRKWKPSTAATNQERINFHLVKEIGEQTLGDMTRDDLQSLLEQKASEGRSHSLVDHLRWDLKQIFNLAWAEGFVSRNPAAVLFTPRHARRDPRLVMNLDQVRTVFSLLGMRERLIVKLAILAGLRPGEIFGLTWEMVYSDFLEIRQRVYRGKVDTSKTSNSVRKVAVSTGLSEEINLWRGVAFDTKPGAWVFPSEGLKTPLSKVNCWRRYIGPKIQEVGLGWVNFQVMRRTHSSLMNDLKVDPKVVADQLGYTLDVNQNVYTQLGLERRKEAVEILESAVGRA